MKFRSFIIGIALCFSVCAMAGITAAKSVGAQGSYFFLQSANHVVLKPGKLMLLGVKPDTLWFKDAPSSDTGFVDMHQYMNLWNSKTSDFQTLHPNATLVGYIAPSDKGTEQKLTIVATLENADYDAKSETLTYQIKKSYLMPDKQEVKSAAVLYHPSLFIDPAVSPFGGGGSYS